MNDIGVLAAAWCRTGWTLLLVFTAAVLLVAALRKPVRKAFGAERAFLLWLLPALAMPASLLPHAASTTAPLPPIVLKISSLPGISSAAVAGAPDGRIWLAALWLAGVVVTLLLASRAQWRYRSKLHGAVAYAAEATRWPIVRASDSRTGPALVGAWRPQIVVPSDFDVRFDSDERALILAHEAMHARRRDGWWCLLAQIAAATFWFHPLAWWALTALRHDQELACDAGVLREHRGRRRSYGNAMLKTQSAALALPVGCAWSPRHPLTERIVMLKQAQPGSVRRLSGAVLMAVIIPLGVGVAYAATTPAPSSPTGSGAVHAGEYQLGMKVEWIDGNGVQGRVRRASVAMCQSPDKAMRVNFETMAVETIVTPLQDNRVRIAATLFDADGHKLAQPVLAGALGGPLRVAVGDTGTTPRYALDVTPVAGCPARIAKSRR
jgi:beta-lactamase regulating signal transducer with metallopeptidase domain